MSEAPLVIFDCDGVLVDSEPIAVAVDRLVLRDLGWSMSEQEVARRFVGRSHDHFVAEVERHLGRSLPTDWEAEYQPLYTQALRERLETVPGIIEALDQISYATCVASNTPHRGIRLRLEVTGLLDRFAGRIFSSGDVAHPKPAPDVFELAAATFGRSPTDCVVVEDSVSGVRAAVAAGMRVLGYAGGFHSADSLAEAGARPFHHMRALGDSIRSVIPES